MISDLKDKLIFGKNYCAIEYSFDKEGKEVLYCLLLTNYKNTLTVTKSNTFFSTEEALSFLKTNSLQHVLLTINNNQVLTKKHVKTSNESGIFNNAFPTLSFEDFEVQTYDNNEDTFIAISRKNYISSLIAIFKNNNINVLDFSLGNLALSAILDMIPKETIHASNAKIELSAQGIDNILQKQFSSEFYTINGLEIKNNNLLNLGTIVHFHLLKERFKDSLLEEEYTQKKSFQLGFKAALITLFIVLFVNFLFFNSYYSKTNILSEKSELNKGMRESFNMVKTSLTRKEKLLDELQNSTSISISKYVDQIVLNLPKSILLSEIRYQPLVGSLKKGKKAIFTNKTIEVKGLLEDNIAFTNWVDELERQKWVKKIAINDIDKDLKRKKSDFHLLLSIK